MTRPNALALAAVLVVASTAAAQPPPKANDSPRAVTLPLAEYNRLLDSANRPPPVPTAPPLASVLSAAEIRVRVEQDSARGVFTLTGDALRPGISRVNLMSGATLMEASIGGRPVPLTVDGNAHTALVPGPGPFSLTIEWGASLKLAPGRAAFVLPVPKSGTARATIDVPGDQADVHLSSGIVTRRSIASGRTIVEATLDPGSATEVWWSMRDSGPAAAARDLRILADVLTLVTLGDSDVRMVALVDLNVVQGDARVVEVRVPGGYEVTGVSGSSLESSDRRDAAVQLHISEPGARRHQFLISLERPHEGGSFALDSGIVTVPDAQRERGEIAVEGVGTLELTATEREGMHRLDVRELNQALQSLSRLPVLAAFRYQRSAGATAGLTLDVKRFADSGVLAAFADRAVATTLVTTEGRALTEIALTVQNRAQPFLKVTLPAGASIVSVKVAGETAKPVLGADGARVPLLRPGFRPNGPYRVTFVYLHAGTPFARKGDLEMTLPRMDMPVGLVEWEVFVPDNYSARPVGGNVIDRLSAERAAMLPNGVPESSGAARSGSGGAARSGSGAGVGPGAAGGVTGALIPVMPGQIRGRVVDARGEPLPGATITVDSGQSHQEAVAAADGSYVLSVVPSGQLTIGARLDGFATSRRTLRFDQRPRQVDFTLPPAGASETVTVAGESPAVIADAEGMEQKALEPSQNVVQLQRRTAGVLPVRLDVPRAGTSHRFVKPLVVDQVTAVTFRYKRR